MWDSDLNTGGVNHYPAHFSPLPLVSCLGGFVLSPPNHMQFGKDRLETFSSLKLLRHSEVSD